MAEVLATAALSSTATQSSASHAEALGSTIQSAGATLTVFGHNLDVIGEAVEYVYFNVGVDIPDPDKEGVEYLYFNVGVDLPDPTDEGVEYVYFNVEEALPYESLNMRIRYLVTDLADLADVDLDIPPSNQDVLVWDEGMGMWVPRAYGGGNEHTHIEEDITDLGDYVSRSGDTMSGDLEVTLPDGGLILRDSNGNRYKLTVSTSGNLIITAL